MSDGAPQPAPLDYASGNRRRRRRWVPLAIVLAIAIAAYSQRDRLVHYWQLAVLTSTMSRSLPAADKRRLRIFAGQPDESDPTRFWFDSEIDEKRFRTTMRILDPDKTSTVPTWPRIEVVRPDSE